MAFEGWLGVLVYADVWLAKSLAGRDIMMGVPRFRSPALALELDDTVNTSGNSVSWIVLEFNVLLGPAGWRTRVPIPELRCTKGFQTFSPCCQPRCLTASRKIPSSS